MIIDGFRKCKGCGLILLCKEDVCPNCKSTDIQHEVTEEELIDFLIDIDELPKGSTMDDLQAYIKREVEESERNKLS